VPVIYTKLVNVDKVDLLIGPYATNMVAPVIPVLMQSGRMTVGILANAANGEFHYDKYFSMNATGPEPERSYAEGFFALAAAQRPRPRTVALVSVDAEYGRNAVAGARQVIAEQGFTIVYDRSYPPANTDFAPTMRAVQAAGADLVYVAAYPPDTVGIVRAANEIGLDARMFGGAMVGLLVTAVKLQLGPAMNGIVNGEVFLPAKTFDFKGTARLIQQYQARAQGQGVDPLGYTFPPFGYAAGQVLADAVAATGTLDHAKLAQYIHTHGFETVVGPIAFGKDGEWTEARRVFTQFRNVQPNDVEQFRDTRHEEIVWPDAFKTADIIYPYGEARK
jgi:branched-chain amino acid transport system substrate-binding protein